jgi:hypothetical protein
MQHLVHNVRYTVVPINSSLFTITLYSSVRTTLVHNHTKYLVPFTKFEPFNTGIKSLRAALPDEIFYWGVCFLNRACN